MKQYKGLMIDNNKYRGSACVVQIEENKLNAMALCTNQIQFRMEIESMCQCSACVCVCAQDIIYQIARRKVFTLKTRIYSTNVKCLKSRTEATYFLCFFPKQRICISVNAKCNINATCMNRNIIVLRKL